MPREAMFENTGVLIVDDDQYLRKIIRSLLIGFGVPRVYEAGDGAQGLELLHQFRPELVLTDWEMPMLDGAEMVRLIRRPSSPYATIGIIMMTAHTERSRIQLAMRLGVNEVLAKPFSAKSLRQRMELVVHHPRPFVQQGAYFGPAPRKPIGLPQRGLGETAPAR